MFPSVTAFIVTSSYSWNWNPKLSESAKASHRVSALLGDLVNSRHLIKRFDLKTIIQTAGGSNTQTTNF